MRNKRRGNSRDKHLPLENLRVNVEFYEPKTSSAGESRAQEQMLQFLQENFTTVQQFMELNKQSLKFVLVNIEILRAEAQDKDIASSARRPSPRTSGYLNG
ncbi:hypothetical protein ACH5RR_036846 [Cinchona calisaya]|uniref:Uncharacterized protein n=1 Tax=Cinchona calisaya TaxID=153742 RepID=A0ABD2Y948_9GENT